MKRIITACGSGVATSETVAAKVRQMLEDAGLKSKASVEAVDIKSIEAFIRNADIYITITPGMGEQFDIPTFNGIPFLTGIGIQAEFDKIVALL